mmetsp:Transcript_2621/g.7886  ORF Transcript_2621/g.7886 Transcript_2621/m.7886 type:complete len:524 (+) Transcript_2621:259-1830(+)
MSEDHSRTHSEAHSKSLSSSRSGRPKQQLPASVEAHSEEEQRRRNVILKRRKRQLAYLARKKEKKGLIRDEMLEELTELLNRNEDEALTQLYSGVMGATNTDMQQRRLVEAATAALSVFPETFSGSSAADILHVSKELAEKILQFMGRNRVLRDRKRWQIVANTRQLVSERNASLSGLVQLAKDNFVEHFYKAAEGLAMVTYGENGGKRREHLIAFNQDRFNFEQVCHLPKVRLSYLGSLAYVMRQCIDPAERVQIYEKALEGRSTVSEGRTPDERYEIAIIQLALAESHFDRLKYADARVVLNKGRHALEQLNGSSLLTTVKQQVSLYRARLLDVQLLSGLCGIPEARDLLRQTINCLCSSRLETTSLMFEAMIITGAVCMRENDFAHASQAAQHAAVLIQTLALEDTPHHSLMCALTGACFLFTGRLEPAEFNLAKATAILAEWSSMWTQLTINHCLDLEVFILEGFAKIRKAKMDMSAHDTARQAIELARLRCIPDRYKFAGEVVHEESERWISRLRAFP